MTDLRQGTGVGRNHLCSLNPVCRSDGTCTGAKNSSDFDFWGERGTTDYDDLGGGEVEDQTRADTEGYYGAQSPRLWRGKNFGYEASPLLPYKHCHSYPSPKSRLQAIIDGRRELMEMVKDLPESSYELSLKDIVDEGHVLQGFQHEDDMSEGEKNRILETKVKSKQKTKKKKGIGRRSQMLRSESMDSGVFLLKMFFPTSLAAKKKKPTVEHCPRGSPGASLEGSEKHGYKSWWKIRLLVTGGHEKSAGNGRSSGSRNADGNLPPGCWFFYTKKCKSTERHGCIF